ncbi:hypothetical protein D9M68_832880 [compost metagenome]
MPLNAIGELLRLISPRFVGSPFDTLLSTLCYRCLCPLGYEITFLFRHCTHDVPLELVCVWHITGDHRNVLFHQSRYEVQVA